MSKTELITNQHHGSLVLVVTIFKIISGSIRIILIRVV
jgi:hypothetical protein